MSKRAFVAATVAASFGFLLLSGVATAAGEVLKPSLQAEPDWTLLCVALAFLLPAGLTLIGAASSREREAPRTALGGLLALPLALLAYALLGFGLQFGGLGLVSNLPGAENLIREWSPLDVAWGLGWGAMGLRGFGILRGSFGGELISLFLFHSALLATATAIPLLTLARRLNFPLLLLVALLMGGVIYPLFGNWVWGGGWLSQLGKTVGLGHGFIDFAGAGTVYALGASVALAGILVFGKRLPGRRGPIAPPPAHFPLLAILGTFLVVVGWLGVVLGNPLLSGDLPFPQTLLNLLLSASGGLLVAALYTWLTAGEADNLMAVRGGVAGLVAVSAGAPFISPWAALVVGIVAGFLLPLILYLVEVRLRLDDPLATASTLGVPGLWGLLALGLFADGRSGLGWNGTGVEEHLGIPGQGVSGYFVVSGFQPGFDQLYAQLVGAVALLIFAGGLAWLLLRGLDRLATLLGQPRLER